MKCLRCGYCCCHYLVIILIDPNKGLIEENVKGHGTNGPERCMHLRGHKFGEYSCAIHDHPLYSETPCASHNSDTETGTGECQIGKYVRSHPLLMDEERWQLLKRNLPKLW